MNKPYSEAAHQNRDVILTVLTEEFKQASNILEIGSGSGQHAVYFSKHLPHLTWQPSDQAEHIAGIQLWINENNSPGLCNPVVLDVCASWPEKEYDGIFAANIAHIMHTHEIEAMFAGVAKHLRISGKFCLYGPFNINGQYTSASNENFDSWLKQRDPESYIRDKNDLDQLAKTNNLTPARAWEMPANNFVLSWQKS